MRTLLALLSSRSFIFSVLGITAFVVAVVWTKHRLGLSWRSPLRRVLLSLLVVVLSVGSAYFWFTNRPLPPDVHRQLFEGITYIREVRRTPHPMVIHIVTIDLTTPDLAFLVTPGAADPYAQLQARTTSQFLTEFGAQVAINGDFFWPFKAYTPWLYYPKVGDWVKTMGFASSQGKIYNTGEGYRFEAMYISRQNRISFVAPLPSDDIYNVISGDKFALYNGSVPVDDFTDAYHLEYQPRTAAGVSEDGSTLYLILIDGRQPNYSDGATLQEVGEIARQYGAYTAINLDGGGSTTLVIEGEDGQPVILNSPIDGHLPGRERPVANHLGIFVSAAAE